jgi:formate hydrogenlyase subunit 6/NADH:ubiquinone oxidoreductase subunit I
MGLLGFTPARCVRALSVNAECRICDEACPSDAITLEGRLPSINHALCVLCGSCVGGCPTEALKLDDFDSTEFFFSFAAEEGNLLSCQKNLPCLAALSDEHLLSLARLKGGLVLDVGHCKECEIGEAVLDRLYPRLENLGYLLEALESSGGIECRPVAYQNGDTGGEEGAQRRDFFKTFHLRGIIKARSDFEKEVQKATDEFVAFELDSSHTQQLRTKKITERRKLFFTALKRTGQPEILHVVDAQRIAFTSQKLFDESKCTACEMCYRVCPTGALSSDIRNSKIDFDPFLCVKCHLCHDVCESGAISLSGSYNLKEWYAPTVQNLVTYALRRCNECDTLFSSVGGEKICRRCRLEEEEAMELWGLKP